MTPTPLPSDDDGLFSSKAEVEWSDLPGQMPSSLDDLKIPEPAAGAKERRPRGTNMSFGFALLWCLPMLAASQVLGAALMFALIFADHFEEIQKAAGNEEELKQLFEGFIYSKSTMLPAAALTQVGLFAFSALVLRWRLGSDWRCMISLGWPQWDHVVLVLVGMPALLVMLTGLEAAVSKVAPAIGEGELKKFLESTATWPWWMAVLCIGVGPGIGEELWFRGFLGRGLVGRYGYILGILFTSFLFGFIHLIPRQAICAGIIGLVLHFSYLATRSILIPMLIHFLNNGLQALSISHTGNVPLITSLEETYDRADLRFLFAAGMVVALVGLALYQSRIRRVSLEGIALTDSLEVPKPGGQVQLIREPIPPATVVLVVLALSAFSAIWWNM